MKNFMIGQFGKFDYEKFNRDYRESFYGIEACLLESEADITNLAKEAITRGFNIGIHFPLRAGIAKWRDPQFLSLNEDIRAEAFKTIENELIFIKQKQIKPKYVLFHYPKPVILDRRVDWRCWRFTDDSEFTFESDYSFEALIKHSVFLFEWMSEKAVEYDFIPVLEFDGLNKYVYDSQFLEGLLERHSKIKLCLDIGRLHLQDKIDAAFDSFEIIQRFIKYAEIIHLWNVKISSNLENSHYPALPELKPKDGWAAVDAYFKIIKKGNKNVKIMFEHRSELITDDELESCYKWIDQLINGID
jgi:hypothetical protein